MGTTQPPTFTHTKALLNYLFVAYGRAKSRPAKPTSSAPPGLAPITSPLASLVSSVASMDLSTYSSNTSSVDDGRESEESDKDASSSAPSSLSSTSSATDFGGMVTEEAKIESVIELLQDDAIDEDDKPEALKDLLSSLLSDADGVNLDPQILALLHRYHEDVNPSNNPVPPLPNHGGSTPLRPSVSRSSSFRRDFTPTNGLSMSSSSTRNAPPTPVGTHPSSSSVSSSCSRSAPTSPFRAPSPAPRSTHQTPSHSPWSSPRPTPLSLAHLSATAPEFKFSPGASEFNPIFSSSSFETSSRHSSRPGTPVLPRSPAHQAQALWASTSSPLGTPKYAGSTSGYASGSASNSALSSPSYFPQHLAVRIQQHFAGKSNKPARLPWADATDSSGSGVEDEYDDQEEEEEEDDPEPNDYGYPMAHLQKPEHFQHLAEQQQDEWDASEESTHVFGSSALGGDYVAQPTTAAWDPFEESEANGDDEESYLDENDPASHETSLRYGAGLGGLGGLGDYILTPFDQLHSVFAGSGTSAEVLEEALARTGYDVDQAIEYIVEHQQQSDGSLPPLLPTTLYNQALPGVRTNFSSGSRPLIVSRDSFEGYVGGNGGRGTPTQKWQASRPQTPTTPGASTSAVGGRVCRYYLAGNCLRSDCKFSHDVGKAVCKFWLRGNCLKGDGRCDFLHSIPPIMRADFEQRAQQRAIPNVQFAEEVVMDDSGPDLDFPSLGEAPRSRRPGQPGGRTVVQLDPTRTRFSGAVKFGITASPAPPSRPPPPSARDSQAQPRPSSRIPLRPPSLLPTVATGTALSALYSKYRLSFLELGANRNKCLARAADCWRKGDGAGARKWSRDASDWNRQVAIEGRDSAMRIVEERKKLMKEAIQRNEGRAGTTEDAADRRVRGREMAGGLCLGVVSQAVLPHGRLLSSEERTECAIDTHGLHPDEGCAFLGEFLLALERERYLGLAYCLVGQRKHTGASDAERGAAAGRQRLEQACTTFLSDQGWAWSLRDGIICIDALR